MSFQKVYFIIIILVVKNLVLIVCKLLLLGSDHPTPFAQGCPDNTPGAMYFPSHPHELPPSLQNLTTPTPEDYGANPDPHLPAGWKSLGPQWGPLEMINELGCPPNTDSNGDNETVDNGDNNNNNNTESTSYVSKRQFNETDFQLKFQPREEFGGPRVGFVFRMGAQGLGYYEDLYATPISPTTTHESNQTDSTINKDS